jgi:hypothetical protein
MKLSTNLAYRQIIDTRETPRHYTPSAAALRRDEVVKGIDLRVE